MNDDNWEDVPAALEGDSRTYYPNKPLAQTAVNRGQTEFRDQGVYDGMAQFASGRGFVAVLFAPTNIPEAWDAGFEVVTRAEMDHVTPTPDDWASPKLKPGKASASTGGGGGGAPSKGATARVWAIADAMHEETPLVRSDRARVVAECVSQGINSSTAGTQWSKWAKDKGL